MTIIHADQALTSDGWANAVEIEISASGLIDSIGPRRRPAAAHVGIALPAPVNLHSHAFQRAMSGLTETRGPDPSDTFWTWRRLMYRFLERLTPEHMQSIAALVFMEMAEAGYAGVAEFHYLHHGPDGTPYDDLAEMAGRIVAAADQTGLGLTLLPVLYQFGGLDARALAGGQRRFGNDPDRFAALHEKAAHLVGQGPADWTIGVAPHSLRAVDVAGLNMATVLAPGAPIHMHLAEQVAEVDEVLAHTGARPTEWLLDNHAVGPRWCLIHSTQMTAQETSRLAASGAVAGLCPITESNLGDGIFNGTQYLGEQGKIGIGSDSNIHISLFDELRTLEYSQRLRDRSRAALARPGVSTGRVLYDAAARGGAQAAGRGAGALAPGMLADIVGLDADNQWIANRRGDAALDSLVFTGYGQHCVREVWSAGRHIVSEGRHPRHDAIVAAYMRTMKDLGQDI
jgi:formimidoylglutamate deiminase